MRIALLSLALVVVGCSSETLLGPDADAGSPDVATIDAGRPDHAVAADANVPPVDSGVDAPVVVDAASLDPACNGESKRAFCDSIHAPHAYGVEVACNDAPFRLVDGGAVVRPDGRVGCFDFSDTPTMTRALCCPD